MYADEKVIIHTVSPLPMPVETTSGVASCKTKIHLLSDQLPKRAFFGGAEAIARRVFLGPPGNHAYPLSIWKACLATILDRAVSKVAIA
jgi:hypothetical protein